MILAHHVPSLTDEDDQVITERAFKMVSQSFGPIPDDEIDTADLAVRTCSCGKKINGFYPYVDHLEEVFNRQAEAAAREPTLDVERLTRAFYNTPRKPHLEETEAEHIARAAAEYARLAEGVTP